MNEYWRSIEERDGDAKSVESDDGRFEASRRDFLKAAGFTLAGLAAACHRPPVDQAVPYLTAPEAIVPGRAYWMASTCHGCPARCGILVKCRDGRPIKIEGNPDHPLSRGGVCAVGQATVLELYDSQRLSGPVVERRRVGWPQADAFVAEKLRTARKVRVVSSTLGSPAAARAIGAFLSQFEDGRHVTYDVPSCSAIADAHERTHGVRVIPRYRFDQAKVIISIDADFLDTWISPVQFTKEWSGREAGSWHTQLEPRMSITGSKADQRLRLHPADYNSLLSHLASALGAPVHGGATLPVKQVVFDRMLKRLKEAAGRSLVVSGSQRVDDQVLVNGINTILGNYGTTILLDQPSFQREGNDGELARLIEELPQLDALIAVDCNPVYDLPDGDVVAGHLARIPLVITTASHLEETSKHAHVIAPDHHFLESWRDSEPVAGVYAVTQPAIAPLRNTRSVLESFASWSGTPATAYAMIKSAHTGDWDKTVHDGHGQNPLPGGERVGREAAGVRSQGERSAYFATPLTPAPLPAGERGIRADAPAPRAGLKPAPTGDEFTPVLYPSIAMLDGRHAHNAWLHELPDPISKVTWDNFAALSPDAAKALGVIDGDVIRMGSGSDAIELPAFVQPGQHDRVVAIALGYGRVGTERFARVGPKWILGRTHQAANEPVGRRAIQLARHDAVRIEKTGRRHPLATTQLHNSMEGRDLARELHSQHGHYGPKHNLWPAKAPGKHRWSMAIDLNRCTGCSGCVIACQAENNVPVVGKDEVLREREMHWMRIDRYYSGDGDETNVVFQPMLCHHCGNAPCETVCPVAATVHSSDGLNQQVYNRCVGTRYCANNCPYKTRRFNWFDYPHEDRFANLVLNPDVAVRSRGVMEKCSMCVQRIEEGRVEAKRLGIPIADGAIRTACQQSCPADAIVFGDLNDPKSRIAEARRDGRHYRLLEEINVDPAVGYLRLTRNHDHEVEHV
jgi:Fe-S-cluster-containing dehydrogenase component